MLIYVAGLIIVMVVIIIRPNADMMVEIVIMMALKLQKNVIYLSLIHCVLMLITVAGLEMMFVMRMVDIILLNVDMMVVIAVRVLTVLILLTMAVIFGQQRIVYQQHMRQQRLKTLKTMMVHATLNMKVGLVMEYVTLMAMESIIHLIVDMM